MSSLHGKCDQTLDVDFIARVASFINVNIKWSGTPVVISCMDRKALFFNKYDGSIKQGQT